jgi:hypothetical protein
MSFLRSIKISRAFGRAQKYFPNPRIVLVDRAEDLIAAFDPRATAAIWTRALPQHVADAITAMNRQHISSTVRQGYEEPAIGRIRDGQENSPYIPRAIIADTRMVSDIANSISGPRSRSSGELRIDFESYPHGMDAAKGGQAACPHTHHSSAMLCNYAAHPTHTTELYPAPHDTQQLMALIHAFNSATDAVSAEEVKNAAGRIHLPVGHVLVLGEGQEIADLLPHSAPSPRPGLRRAVMSRLC